MRTNNTSNQLYKSILKVSMLIWIGLNLLDTTTTYIIIKLGGHEDWFIYQWTQSMIVTSLVKWLAVIVIPLILIKYNKLSWLWIFNTQLIIIVGLNTFRLIEHII